MGSNHRSPPCHRGVLPAERRDRFCSTPTRGRTWNASFEARDDVRFTTGAAVDRRGVAPRLPACEAGVLLLDEQPSSFSGDDGNRTHRSLFARQTRRPWHMRPHKPPSAKVRPGLEPGLPPYHGGVPPQHLQTDRAERRTSAGDNRLGAPACLYRRPRTLRPTVAEVGVEPTITSPGSRPGRFACLRTRPSVSPGPR